MGKTGGMRMSGVLCVVGVRGDVSTCNVILFATAAARCMLVATPVWCCGVGGLRGGSGIRGFQPWNEGKA